jgi:sugar/nucleoside kinase (ribokinase family)
VQTLAVVGSLSRDLVGGSPPRPGGSVYYAARALRTLGRRASILTKCSAAHRPELVPALVATGLPVTWRPAAETTTFRFSYEGDVRRMAVETVGDPWTADDFRGALAGIRWLHAGALLRSDFPAAILAELGRGRALSLDGQALVRPARTGPLSLEGNFDPELLEHVQILKLSEEEAAALGRPLETLGVPEIVLTLGSRGSIVFAHGRSERIRTSPLHGVDPTGAGDVFAAAYLAARCAGDSPGTAATRASALVSGLLSGRLR